MVLYHMVRKGHPLLLLFAVATLGNYLGALVNYYLGSLGSLRLRAKLQAPRYQRAARLFERWGHLSLLLSWVPVVGDPLTVVAGLAKLPLGRFSFWVILGKGARYAALILLSQR